MGSNDAFGSEDNRGGGEHGSGNFDEHGQVINFKSKPPKFIGTQFIRSFFRDDASSEFFATK
jgi:hypothetical protein